jgi:hypothetical protein
MREQVKQFTRDDIDKLLELEDKRNINEEKRNINEEKRIKAAEIEKTTEEIRKSNIELEMKLEELKILNEREKKLENTIKIDETKSGYHLMLKYKTENIIVPKNDLSFVWTHYKSDDMFINRVQFILNNLSKFDNLNFLAKTFYFLLLLTIVDYLVASQFFKVSLYMFGALRIFFLLLIKMVTSLEILPLLYSVL